MERWKDRTGFSLGAGNEKSPQIIHLDGPRRANTVCLWVPDNFTAYHLSLRFKRSSGKSLGQGTGEGQVPGGGLAGPSPAASAGGSPWQPGLAHPACSGSPT